MSSIQNDGWGWSYHPGFGKNDQEFVQRNERLIYRLRKDTPLTSQGQLYIERCDDGTQGFVAYNPHRGVTGNEVCEDAEFPRNAVINNPEWFEQVYLRVEKANNENPKPNKTQSTKKKRRKRHAPRKDFELRKKRAYEMHLNGKKPKTIARELGVHETTVNSYIRSAKQSLAEIPF